MNPVTSTLPPYHMALHLPDLFHNGSPNTHSFSLHILNAFHSLSFLTKIFPSSSPPSKGPINYNLSNHYFKLNSIMIVAIVGLSS